MATGGASRPLVATIREAEVPCDSAVGHAGQWRQVDVGGRFGTRRSLIEALAGLEPPPLGGQQREESLEHPDSCLGVIPVRKHEPPASCGMTFPWELRQRPIR